MKLVYICLCLIFSITLNAQIAYEDGTEWYYTTTTFSAYGPPDTLINKHYIDGDATILGRSVKVLHRVRQTCDFRPAIEYIYQENDSLYFKILMPEIRARAKRKV